MLKKYCCDCYLNFFKIIFMAKLRLITVILIYYILFLCYEQYLVRRCFHLFKKLLWGYSFLWDFFNEVKKLMLKMINWNKHCRLEVIFYLYSSVYKGLWNRTNSMLVQSNTLDVITFFITVWRLSFNVFTAYHYIMQSWWRTPISIIYATIFFFKN